MTHQDTQLELDEEMVRYEGYVGTDLINSEVTFEFWVEKSATEKEVEEVAREAMFECISWGYSKST